MTADLRTQLAEALNVEGACCGDCGREPGDPLADCRDCERYLLGYADAILRLQPLVAARAEGAAEALRDAADEVHVARFNADLDPGARWPEGSPQKVDSFYAGVVFARGRLRARADAFSPTVTPTTEEDPK